MIRNRLFLALLPLVLLTVASMYAQEPPAKITGTVTYRERIALPADAEIRVVLQDVSKADAAAEVISEVNLPGDGRQVPIPFELTYDPAKIDPSHRYSVRATIRVEGMLAYTTSQSYPVITNGAPHRATLMLQHVGRTAPKASTAKVTPKKPSEETPPAPAPAAEEQPGVHEQPSSKAAMKADAEPDVQTEPLPSPQPPAPKPAKTAKTSSGKAASKPSQPKPVQPKHEEEVASAAEPSKAPAPDTKPASANTPNLANTQWKLYELNGKNIFFAPSERPITLAFSPNGGRIAGSAGCNGYMGTYINENGEFRLKPAGATMMACPDAVMKRESTFLKVLQSADSYDVEDDVLSLTSKGKIVARLTSSQEDLGVQ